MHTELRGLRFCDLLDLLTPCKGVNATLPTTLEGAEEKDRKRRKGEKGNEKGSKGSKNKE